MKTKILTSAVLLLALLNYCHGQDNFISIKLKETVNKDGKTCWKKSGQPLSGNYTIKMSRNEINNERFIDGLKNGECSVYRYNKLVEKGIYFNNLRTNIWESYNYDGSLNARTNFKDGLRDSTTTVYLEGQVIKTLNYHKDRLNGWTSEFFLGNPLRLQEKAFYLNDKKITNISYRAIDSLKFTIVDSLFYNDSAQLELKKSYINDTLKLQVQIKRKVELKIRDVIKINTTQVDIYNGKKLEKTYFFPAYDYDELYLKYEFLHYNFTYYADKQAELAYYEPEKENYYIRNKNPFYMQYPNKNLQLVVYYKGDEGIMGDILPGWIYRDAVK